MDRFTTLARDLAHAPLQGDVYQLMLWLYASPADLTMEKLLQGVRDTRIDDAEESFLPTIAEGRGGVLRGLTEDATSFRARLKTALDDLRLAGNAWSVLRQVLGYVSAPQPRALAVSSRWLVNAPTSSTWDEYASLSDTSKNPTHTLYNAGSAGNWDWDSLSPTDGSWGWWRWYLVIESSDSLGRAWVNPDGKWGSGGAWGDGGAWGVDVPSTVGKSLLLIVAQWKANWCHWVIVSFDGALFDRSLSSGGGVNPDGYFGRWSKVVGGVYVAARFAGACYFEGPE